MKYSTMSGARSRPTTTWRWVGLGRSTRRSRWTKQIASHFGGTRQGMCISWPGHIKDLGGVRTQFHHVIDIVPTILEACRHPAARDSGRHQAEADRRREHGLHLRREQRQRPVETQDAVFRDDGPQGLYHDGWIASNNAIRPPWERWERNTPAEYNMGTLRRDDGLDSDRNIADKNPDKLKELQALFRQEAEIPSLAAGQLA